MPRKPKLILEQAGADAVGEGGDALRIRLKRRHKELAHHHRIDPGGDGRTEGWQFDLIEAFAAGHDAGEGKMGISIGIAVPWEMLGGGHAVPIMDSVDEGRDQFADFARVFSEGAGIDNGIAGIGVHVGIGIEIPVHADGARLGGGDASELIGVPEVAGGAKRHGMRKAGAAVESHRQAALKVGGKQQRQLAIALQLVGEHRRVQRTPLEQQAAIDVRGDAEGAEVVLFHLIAQHQVVRAAEVHEIDLGPDHEQLADFFLQRHLVKRLLSPVRTGWIVGCRRVRYLVSQGCADQREKNEDYAQ